MRHGEESEGENERRGDVLDGDVGGTRKNLVAGDEFGAGEVDGKVGVVVVAGGVLPAVEVHDRVADFFHARPVEKPVALLGDDAGDKAFVGVVVKDNGVGHVFVVALLKERSAGGFAVGVGHGLGGERLFVEIDTNVVGRQLHSVIFYDPFVVQLGLAFVDVDGNRVGGFVVHDAGEGAGRVWYDGHGGAVGCFQQAVGHFCRRVGYCGKGVG